MSHLVQVPAFKSLDAEFLWSKREKRVWCALLCTGCAVLYMARVALPLAAPEVALLYSWDKQKTGSVLAAFFWGYALTQVIGGWLSDRVGGVRVLCWSALGWSLVTLATPEQLAWPGLETVTLARVLVGVLQGVHFPAIASLVSLHLLPEERSFFMGAVISGPALGMLINGSLGSLLLKSVGWRSLFRLVGFTGLLWVGAIHCYLFYLPQNKKSLSNHHLEFHTSSPPVPWTIFFQSPAFWSMLFAHFCETNAYHILINWLPTYFTETFPHAEGWVFNVVPWMVSPVASLFAGWLADSLIATGWQVGLVRKTMESICHVTKALLFLALTSVENYGTALVMVSIIVASGSFHSAGVFLNPQDLAPQFAGAVFGVMNTVGCIPGFVGVYLTGQLLQSSDGDWTLVFLMTAALNVAGFITFLVFGSAKPLVPLRQSCKI